MRNGLKNVFCLLRYYEIFVAMNLRNKEKMNMRKMNVKIITHLIYVAPILNIWMQKKAVL